LKAITLMQPWATLVALGVKRWETRGWTTTHRGPLVVHAGLGVDLEAIARLPWRHQQALLGAPMPTGAVVAVAWLDDVLLAQDARELAPSQVCLGDFRDGRYAWRLERVTPVLVKWVSGRLGIWSYEAQPEVLEAARSIRATRVSA
jgi:hypothetical protein